MKSVMKWTGVLLALVLTLSACGGAGEKKPESTTAAPTQTATAATAADPTATVPAATAVQPPRGDETATDGSATEPELRPDPPSAAAEEGYDRLIAQYADVLTNGTGVEDLLAQGMSELMADCYGDTPKANIGYLVSDLDGDGTPELAVAATEEITDDFYGYLVFDLYTLDGNGAPVQIFSSRARNRYYYIGDGCFARVGSDSASATEAETVKLSGMALDLRPEAATPERYVRMELTAFE